LIRGLRRIGILPKMALIFLSFSRAPHRERYSSRVEHAAVSAAAEEALRPPRCLPLQLQLDHCQHIRGPVFSA
jgi:hypothetical protein